MFLLFFYHPLLCFSLTCSVDSFVEKCRVPLSCSVCKCGQCPGASALLIPKKPTRQSHESEPRLTCHGRLVCCKSQDHMGH